LDVLQKNLERRKWLSVSVQEDEEEEEVQVQTRDERGLVNKGWYRRVMSRVAFEYSQGVGSRVARREKGID